MLGLVFDVGANRGDWTALVLEANASAAVHCFEICTQTYEQLYARFSGYPGVDLNSIGLSDSAGATEVQYCPNADVLSSIFQVMCSTIVSTVPGAVVRGVDYCVDRNIGHIDFLKIDVEGAEHLVLRGFGDLLSPDRVPVVQFEYGMVNIVTKFLLRDFYAHFEGRGYRVGKLFPGYVRFRPYRFQDEDFLGPNYIAASPDVVPLLGREAE